MISDRGRSVPSARRVSSLQPPNVIRLLDHPAVGRPSAASGSDTGDLAHLEGTATLRHAREKTYHRRRLDT